MTSENRTLLIRLAGPMQSWGTASRFQLRRSDAYPSKSGVLGLILCALGVRREDSSAELAKLADVRMGVRVDHAGAAGWDYHTAGANIGIRTAEGKIKKTAATGRPETLLSRRQYLYDASFLAALQADAQAIGRCEAALREPKWPVFLGRKCCVPTELLVEGTGSFDSIEQALASRPWQPRVGSPGWTHRGPTRTLNAYIEHPQGSPAPPTARLVYDVPRAFGFHGHLPRWVVQTTVEAAVLREQIAIVRPQWRDPYDEEWKALRRERLAADNYLCVFCKCAAVDVHHVDYGDVRIDTLRSLCKNCHDACTMLEYSGAMRVRRVDPADKANRRKILDQVVRLLNTRRVGRRRSLREAASVGATEFFDDVPGEAGEG